MKNIKRIIASILSFLETPLFFGIISFKLNKADWYFKISDRDINPSFPHLHSKDGKYKMNIYNGNILRAKDKRVISTLSDDDFIKL